MPSIPFLNKLPWRKKGPVIPAVRLHGVIGDAGRFRQGLTIANTAGLLHKAFSMPGPAVAILINSPGGSPAQSDLIGRRIRALAEEKKKTVYAFTEDVAASGGYWLAVAADEIYALETSLVGSIGVVSGGFGLAGLIKKLGVERRLHTAGEAKARLDPFSPEKPEDVEWLTDLQEKMHDIFKETVKTRRGDRLKAPQETAFSGDVWLGRPALEMGLIDGIGDVKGVMTEKFGKDVRLKLIEARTGMLNRLLGRTQSPAQDWADGLLDAIEARAMWGRFGL